MYLAIDTYNHHKDDFKKLIKQAMEMDYSWNNSSLL